MLANGSLASQQSGEGGIRARMVESDAIDCIVALPSQLFFGTQIPACLWILAKDKSNGLVRDERLRDRRGEVLLIDARKLGHMADRTRRELSVEDVRRIARVYHGWRGEKEAGDYANVPGFCKTATLEEVREQGYALSPGRYVGVDDLEAEKTPFEEQFATLKARLEKQFEESALLEQKIGKALDGVFA